MSQPNEASDISREIKSHHYQDASAELRIDYSNMSQGDFTKLIADIRLQTNDPHLITVRDANGDVQKLEFGQHHLFNSSSVHGRHSHEQARNSAMEPDQSHPHSQRRPDPDQWAPHRDFPSSPARNYTNDDRSSAPNIPVAEENPRGGLFHDVGQSARYYGQYFKDGVAAFRDAAKTGVDLATFDGSDAATDSKHFHDDVVNMFHDVCHELKSEYNVAKDIVGAPFRSVKDIFDTEVKVVKDEVGILGDGCHLVRHTLDGMGDTAKAVIDVGTFNFSGAGEDMSKAMQDVRKQGRDIASAASHAVDVVTDTLSGYWKAATEIVR